MANEEIVHALASPRSALRACLLLLLEERRGHGYELLTRLEPFGFTRANPGRIYRALRWLEDGGLVSATWETGSGGPAQRVFEVTPDGRFALDIVTPSLRDHAKALDPRLHRYVVATLRARAERTQQFDFIVRTTVAAQALDEAAARRKVERVFHQRLLAPDVRSCAAVSVTTTTASGQKGRTRGDGA